MLVLDANILMRAVLGKKVHGLLATYGSGAELVSPGVCFAEARE